MPDLDLKPDEYGERDPRTGRRKVKDDPRVQWFWVIVGVAVLAAIYAYREEISRENVFWGTVMASVVVGGFLWPILSRLDR